MHWEWVKKFAFRYWYLVMFYQAIKFCQYLHIVHIITWYQNLLTYSYMKITLTYSHMKGFSFIYKNIFFQRISPALAGIQNKRFYNWVKKLKVSATFSFELCSIICIQNHTSLLLSIKFRMPMCFFSEGIKVKLTFLDKILGTR